MGRTVLHLAGRLLLLAGLLTVPDGHAAAEPASDVEAARRLAVAAQQRARGEQAKAVAASQGAAQDRSPAAGYGSIVYNSATYYWGEKSAAGQRDGYGIFYYREGRCECRFLRDRPFGAGVIIAADGSRYEGELGGSGSGSAAGYGVYRWPDGRRFEGRFAGDRPNGPGVLTDALGTAHAGIWKNGVLAESRPPPLAEAIAHAGEGAAPNGNASTVPLGNSGGTYTIPVVINGSVRIPFVVDSGAAEVSLPEDVVRVLLRSGTLDKSDLLGKSRYVTADGRTHSGLRLRIRQLQVGERIARDVVAGVSPERGDPLLGQSFLSRFGTWSIDNRAHTLVLSPQ